MKYFYLCALLLMGAELQAMEGYYPPPKDDFALCLTIKSSIEEDPIDPPENPLNRAILRNNLSLVLQLLEKDNIDPNEWVFESPLAASYAQRSKQKTSITKKLLEHGANPNAASNIGTRELELAMYKGSLNQVSLLLEFGADPLQVKVKWSIWTAQATKGIHYTMKKNLELVEAVQKKQSMTTLLCFQETCSTISKYIILQILENAYSPHQLALFFDALKK